MRQRRWHDGENSRFVGYKGLVPDQVPTAWKLCGAVVTYLLFMVLQIQKRP